MPTPAPLVSWHGEHARIPLPLRVLGRYFVTGSSLRGPGDNATFFHAATVDYRARPYITLTAPKWQRLARRNGAISVPVLLTASTITPWVDLWMVATYEGVLFLAAFVWACRRWRTARRDGRRNREWIDPAAHKLANILKRRYVRKEARRLISIPRTWGEPDDDLEEQKYATVHLPEGTVLSKAVRTSIENNIGAALGIPAPVVADWADNGSQVVLRGALRPPAEVTYDGMREAIAACDENEIIVGRTAGGAFVRVDLKHDSPHLAASGGTGTGKSVLVRTILKQRMERGEGVVMFDPKRFSHLRWAQHFGAERIVYCVSDRELHEGWISVGEETQRRKMLPLDELEQQRRVWIVAEEINTQIKILTRVWRGMRQEIMRPARALLADCEKECGGSKLEGLALAEERDPEIMAKLDPPATSPAVVALQEAVFMGRELRMHTLAAAQRLDAAVFGGGGGAVRGSFGGGIFMAKWDRALWKMLAGGIGYVAWPGGKVGIWGIVRGEDFDIFRVPWLDEGAMLEVLKACPVTSGPVLGPQTHRVLGDEGRTAITVGVSLRDAFGRLPARSDGTPVSLDSLRAARGRDASFPVSIGQQGQDKLYDFDDLVRWTLSHR